MTNIYRTSNLEKIVNQKVIGYNKNFKTTYLECVVLKKNGTTATVYQVVKENDIGYFLEDKPEIEVPVQNRVPS